MSLTESQINDYKIQAAALKTKLTTCAKEITSLKQAVVQAESDRGMTNLFLAKLLSATDAKKEFSEAWDRLVLIYIKLGAPKEFPNEREDQLRTDVYDTFNAAKAFEIHLKSEPQSLCQPFYNSGRMESRPGLALLERIKLPQFSGEVTEWARYRDVFTSLVDKDPSLEPVTKLYLLRDSLSGEALSLINKFDITAANYPQAWNSLIEAYENQRVLASAYLEKILSHRMSSRPGLSEFQRFLTEVADNVSSFKALQLDAAEDKILAIAMLRTLDSDTRHKFELHHVGTDFPKSEEIIKFIRNKCQALKLSESHHHTNAPSTSVRSFRSPSSPNAKFYGRSNSRYNQRSFMTSSKKESPRRSSPNTKHKDKSRDLTKLSCSFCQQNHILSRCPIFMGLSVEDRQDFASKWKGCRNCLNPEHATKDCKSRWSCRICNERHHSLLHRQEKPIHEAGATNVSAHVSWSHHEHQETQGQENVTVILGTARAFITDYFGRNHAVRLLLDCGSHRSFITNSLAKSLQLKVRNTHSQITGLGGTTVAETLGVTQFFLRSANGSKIKMTAAVLSDRITSPLPQRQLPRDVYDQFKTLKLADPFFYKPQEIDILLGADFFDDICTGGFFKPNPEFPSVLPTIFGDVIMGSFNASKEACLMSFFCDSSKTLSSQLEVFWKLEEPPAAPRQSPEDQFCEEHYVRTFSRNPDGRYIVRLPFSSDPGLLEDNRQLVQKRFFSLEGKLSANKELRNGYTSFMEEYERLGHMQVAKSPARYLIPHFGIMQQKLRVVFDASCKSRNKVSLNDILHSGPKLQTDICEVLTSFRLFPIAITTDIVKMYRQILIHPEDRVFQHVLWRANQQQDLIEQELNTVTYGLSSSPFHALRTIRQLIQDEGAKFPLAVQRISMRIFVDDVATGADDEREARKLCRELTGLFKSGGFALSKWCSNVPSVLPSDCSPNQCALSPQPENFPDIKVLGLIWNPQDDTFAYVIHDLPAQPFTKRVILSIISRIFDPLGFLAPVIFTAKLFMQDLWKNKSDWDDKLAPHLTQRWRAFTETWNDLTKIRIPRFTSSRHRPCRIIGFCDASASGYAAVVYLHVLLSDDQAKTFLITAKTKVAPIKYMSIARLELCGALLLAKLISTLRLPEVDVRQQVMFTDSRVALGWINSPSYLLHVFEANRVAAIKDLVPEAEWRHVKTHENPADIASRGLIPSKIASCVLWWEGPQWLQRPCESWPAAIDSLTATTEAERHYLSEDRAFTLITAAPDISWMNKVSSLSRLFRTTARILRFFKRSSHNFTKYSEPLRSCELNRAALVCARATQLALFPKGIHTPELSSLTPFLDELGVLKVGGRLVHAPVSTTAKHPVILPKTSHLAKLVVHDIHQRYFHAGPTLTLTILRTKYWIPSGLRYVKSQIGSCITCFRRKPKTKPPMMAPLPSSRFTIGRAFLHTGIDFAGPFTIRDSLRRKPVLSKAYICLFVCFSTKALHLEAVTSLTTEAFIATLDRFVARRGKPVVIHSDNATNFLGASRYLKDVITFLKSKTNEITDHLALMGIDWQFIPPRSPHFGGLWEAGVKSAKSLLQSSIGPTPFTYEELCTVLARIESILNSRPLCPLNDDPTSYEVLTPGHFLIGAPLCALPEEAVDDIPVNRLSRWQLVQRNAQLLWTRWRREYLNTLIQRSKWRNPGNNYRTNDLVILNEKNPVCGHWPMARITEVHPGSDGTVRVVTVKTPNGTTLKRSVHRLAPLPVS